MSGGNPACMCMPDGCTARNSRGAGPRSGAPPAGARPAAAPPSCTALPCSPSCAACRVCQLSVCGMLASLAGPGQPKTTLVVHARRSRRRQRQGVGSSDCATRSGRWQGPASLNRSIKSFGAAEPAAGGASQGMAPAHRGDTAVLALLLHHTKASCIRILHGDLLVKKIAGVCASENSSVALPRSSALVEKWGLGEGPGQ